MKPKYFHSDIDDDPYDYPNKVRILCFERIQNVNTLNDK